MGIHKGTDKIRRKTVIFFARVESVQNSYHLVPASEADPLPYREKVNRSLVEPFFLN
jgi:hypothetical protein